MSQESFERIERLDAELTALVRGAGALRLSFGLILEALAQRSGHHELGFSSVEAYGLEQCERSSRWIQETRSLARRLSALPRLREGVLSGSVKWSMARLLARVVGSADEAVWLALARGQTVRRMEQMLLALQGAPDAGDSRASESANGNAGDALDGNAGDALDGNAGDALDGNAGDALNGQMCAEQVAQSVAPASQTCADARQAEPQSQIRADAGSAAPASQLCAGRVDGHGSSGRGCLKGSAHDVPEMNAADSGSQLCAAFGIQGPEDVVARLATHHAALANGGSGGFCLEDPKLRTLTITVDQPDAWLFECARLVIRRTSGSTAPDAVMQALLGEAEDALLPRVPSSAAWEIAADPGAAAEQAWKAQREQWRQEAEALCEARVAAAAEPQVPCLAVPTLEELGNETLEALDERLRAVADELSHRDVLVGQLAERFWRADGWRHLGYATARQYATERLGMSLSAVKEKRALVRRLASLPELAAAAEQGHIGYEATRLLTRVASADNCADWKERARERTVKHLRGEIAAAELIARALGTETCVPPTAEQMQAYEVLAAKVMSGEAFAGAVQNTEQGVAEAFNSMFDVIGRPRRKRGRVTLRLRVGEETYWHYKSRERLHRRYGSSGSFLRFLCLEMIHTWKHTLKAGVKYEEVYARDRFQCASPVCSRHDVTPHHLVFRSRGGSDLAENLLSLCVWCHLEGIHNGRLKATAPATNVRWTIGRRGHTVVEGRVKQRTAA